MDTVIHVKERGYASSIILFISAFIIIIGTALPWIEIEIDLGPIRLEIGEWNLHDYDETYDTGFGGALVLFSIFLIIIAFISLVRYHVILKVLAILLSLLALLITFAAISEIIDRLEPIEGFYGWRIGYVVTLFGCFLAIISSALLKGPQKIPAVLERPIEKPVTTTPTTTPPQKTREPSLPKETVKEQIICKNCNKPAPKTSTFCPFCGTYLHENTNP